MLMKRGRFKRPEHVARGAMAWRGFSDEEGLYWEPKDIQVGSTYIFNKREMFVFDASEETYKWYEEKYQMNMRIFKKDRNELIPPKEILPKSAREFVLSLFLHQIFLYFVFLRSTQILHISTYIHTYISPCETLRAFFFFFYSFQKKSTTKFIRYW